MTTTTTPLAIEEFALDGDLPSPSANALFAAMMAALVTTMNEQLAKGVPVRQLHTDLRDLGLSKDVGYCLLDAAERRGLPITDAASDDADAVLG